MKLKEKATPVGDEKSDDPLDDWHWERRLAEDAHCTAYVKLTPSDLMVGHATWGDYAQMLRIYKYYDFALTGGGMLTSESKLQSFDKTLSS